MPKERGKRSARRGERGVRSIIFFLIGSRWDEWRGIRTGGKVDNFLPAPKWASTSQHPLELTSSHPEPNQAYNCQNFPPRKPYNAPQSLTLECSLFTSLSTVQAWEFRVLLWLVEPVRRGREITIRLDFVLRTMVLTAFFFRSVTWAENARPAMFCSQTRLPGE